MSTVPTAVLPADAALESPPPVRAATGARLRPAPALLAPTLPALLLVALCIAGMNDPSSSSGAPVSRLHVSMRTSVDVARPAGWRLHRLESRAPVHDRSRGAR